MRHLLNPDISWDSSRIGAKVRGYKARREGDEGIFNDMSSRPNKRNVVDMHLCVDAVESHEISGLNAFNDSDFIFLKLADEIKTLYFFQFPVLPNI